MATITNDNLEKEIRAIIAEILEIDEEKIKPDAKFIDELGMDSMMALEIFASIEKRYKIKIPEDNLSKVNTLKNVVTITKEIISKAS